MANPPFGSTNTKPRTLQVVLDEANPTEIADGLAQLDLGTVFTVLKRAFTGLTAAAAFDLTLIDGTGETVGISNVNRRPANLVRTLRCTASGTANSVGSYVVTDAAGTPTSPTASTIVGLATISDDGKTITFPTTVTAFVIEYMPLTVSAAAMATAFPNT